MLKLIGATAVVVLVFAYLAVRALDEDDGDTGMARFRAFAPQIDAAIRDHDADFFARRAIEREATCELGTGSLGPENCDERGGITLRGFYSSVGPGDSAFLYARDEYRDILATWFAASRPDLTDSWGNGKARLWSLSRLPVPELPEVAPDEPAYQVESYWALVTGIFDPTPGPFFHQMPGPSAAAPVRQYRYFTFVFLDGSWHLRSEFLHFLGHPAVLTNALADRADAEPWPGR